MSKESRLCYHAVPRIMTTNVDWLKLPSNELIEIDPKDYDENHSEEVNQNRKKRRLPTPSENEYNDSFVEGVWASIADTEQWKPFGDYITDCRINVNVRQVLEHGEKSLHSN